MSSLIEYSIELNTVAEEMAQEAAARPVPSSEPQTTPESHRQHPKLQRQESVLCSRIQHLSTIDYVEDGKLGLWCWGGKDKVVHL